MSRLSALVAASLLLCGCSVGYVARQSVAHVHVLAARQPVDKAIARGRVPEEWIEPIRVIEEAREFGVRRLGLPAENLYRSISLVRPGPTWVVSASAKDALRPVSWWFPVTGRVDYRGYYNRGGAEKLARRLGAKELDVLVRPAGAFSTLGWFADPIRPSMLDRSESELVNLVLHEAAHRVLYLSGQTDFNESFASFVGDAGALLYLRERYGAGCDLCRETEAGFADELTFRHFLDGFVEELHAYYARSVDREQKIRGRDEIFRGAQERFARLDWNSSGYEWFEKLELDNARILSFQRYAGDRSVFERVLDACDGDLGAAIRFVETLGWKKVPKREREQIDPFRLLQRRLDEGATCPAAPG